MEGYAGTGLQRLLVEKKVSLYASQKRGIFTSAECHFTLCLVDTWRKNKWRLPIDTRRCPHHTDKKAAKGEGFSERFFDFPAKEWSAQMAALHYTDISSPECKVFGENICKKI